MKARAIPVVEECLEEQGRTDLVPDIERYLRSWIESAPAALIATERYRREGVNPPGTLVGVPVDEVDDSTLVTDCYFEEVESGNTTAARILQLQGRWTFEVQNHFSHNPLLDEFATFEQCLADEAGYPPQGVEPGVEPDLFEFLYWWPAQHGGDQEMSQEDNLKGGRIFADCLDPYTDAQAEVTDEMREQFIDDNYRTLKRINDELVG